MRRTIATLALLAGCELKGDGTPAEAERTVPPLAQIEVFDDFEVTVTVRPELDPEADVTLRVTGDANALGRLFTEVHGDGVLSIAADPNLRQELTLKPTVTLEVPALVGVFASDRAVVRVLGASGALAIEAELASLVEASELTEIAATVVARDASRVTLAGAGPEVTIAASDMAHVGASRLTAEHASVTVDGESASVTVCTSGAAPTIEGEAALVTVACD
ncbi:GIN domain-containing protein [Nannocystis bainbridge]|uniref:DUF2807 domain-containing protein n=1 Tax=Nannocystis bainbridge TaxID=2995303 RepID=A0ABT5E9H5_9BACT|nr:DUF2807 domain-containing protein [Nannocystis bainbridge]MDC0722075.1 DUF2807 domain-containing protein [Nannocystis bainbridge]